MQKVKVLMWLVKEYPERKLAYALSIQELEYSLMRCRIILANLFGIAGRTQILPQLLHSKWVPFFAILIKILCHSLENISDYQNLWKSGRSNSMDSAGKSCGTSQSVTIVLFISESKNFLCSVYITMSYPYSQRLELPLLACFEFQIFSPFNITYFKFFLSFLNPLISLC